MSSGYERFTNDDLEGGQQGVPPDYKASEVPSNVPPQYPTQQPPPYPPQQPIAYNIQQVAQAPVQQTIMHVAAGPTPKDYFGFALFVTICCCLPFGIVGLIKSSEVKNRAAAGDYGGAAISSSEAKRWSWAGCIIGGISWGIALVVMCVYVGLIVAACNAGDCESY